mmetsp:Transcript_12785/g.16167  ORF Transcript_12785/g.16167 Transcript_12785/m.16167 type:complete len:124 (+) Transcript_12785:572-943(+)
MTHPSPMAIPKHLMLVYNSPLPLSTVTKEKLLPNLHLLPMMSKWPSIMNDTSLTPPKNDYIHDTATKSSLTYNQGTITPHVHGPLTITLHLQYWISYIKSILPSPTTPSTNNITISRRQRILI